VTGGSEDLADRLSALAEELADAALDCLRRAAEEVRSTGVADSALVAEEKRLTRARRAVDKAVTLLRSPTGEGAD
jgi:hypothetical protein